MTRPRANPKPELDDLIAYVEAGNGGLLGELVRFIRLYVVMSPPQLIAVALWTVHSHGVMSAEQTPYLSITSPERECGKSRLLEVLRLLVARVWYAISPSEAVLYRQIHGRCPTLLLDEVDAFFNPRTADRHEHVRAALNAGIRRGATVPRCVGATFKMVEFRVYCPKALAGIGTLPDTLASRSIPIRLQRKARHEQIKRFYLKTAEPEGKKLHDRVEAWAATHEKALRNARPELPEELSDRMAEACEPLFAIADKMRGPWPALARNALVALCTEERPDNEESMRLRLLADVRGIFEENGNRKLSTETLIDRLIRMEEAPWRNYYGRTLEPKDVASLLRPYGIEPKNLKLKKDGKLVVRRGYYRRPLQDAWERYT